MRRSLFAPWLVALAVTSIYSALSWNSGFLYDDQALIEDEVPPETVGDVLRAFAEPHYGALPYYRPIVRATYLAQKAFAGDDPRPYHLANALLAGAIALAAWLLLRSPPLGTGAVPAAAAAAAFVLHPAAGSAVLPIAGRDSLLPALFILLCVAAHLRPTLLWRIAAPLAFLAALFSKEVAVATPLVLVAADLTLAPSRPRGWRAWTLRYAPFAGALAVYAVARAAVLPGGAPEVAILDRPFGPLLSLAFGLQTAIAPAFSLVYEPSPSAWLSPVRTALAGIVAVALGWAALRENVRGIALFWAAWFVALQLPSANFFVQETLLDERYVFPAVLAAPGIVAAIGDRFIFPFRQLRASAQPRKINLSPALLLAMVLVFVPIEMIRARTYASARTFHEQWVRTNPGSAAAHNSLGTVRLEEQRIEEALAHFETSLRLRPEEPQTLSNLGVAFVAAGRPGEAVSSLRRAVELRPESARAWYNLGNALAAAERPAESEAAYREALRLRPAYPQAWNNLAAALVRLGRADEALAALAEVERLDPTHVRARLNRGILLARAGRLDEAVRAYEEVLVLAPDDADAHFDLAAALEQLRRTAEAHGHYRRALGLRPGWGPAAAGVERTARAASP